MPGGRIAVLSYHSGEDRIVKERFRVATGACDCPPESAVRLRRGADRASRARRAEAHRGRREQAGNRRAASARLRVAERIEPTHDGSGR